MKLTLPSPVTGGLVWEATVTRCPSLTCPAWVAGICIKVQRVELSTMPVMAWPVVT